MAKKKEEAGKVVLERAYNVPLRREWLKVPRYRRANKAASALRQFMARHMKTKLENVKIMRYANELIWVHGIKNPPHHIKVNAIKDDKGMVKVELVGKKIEQAPKKVEKKKKAEEKTETKDEKKIEKLEDSMEGVKEEKADKAKETQAEEIKELKHEQAAMSHATKEPIMAEKVGMDKQRVMDQRSKS